jgi:hypothetical protein
MGHPFLWLAQGPTAPLRVDDGAPNQVDEEETQALRHAQHDKFRG